ncbi:MAG TPA: histidine phosphatase family protein [Streptosporangiaceae bacterium]|nr:histidine phosphatase family protein [Streptosporangiaceae bacterium]
MGDSGRVLLVLRHSKAVHEAGLRDLDRGLTKRGRRDAAAAGTMMRDAGLIPDRVLCSAALRTRQTWQHVSEALGPAADKAKVRFESRLYDADETALLQAVRRTPDKAGTVLLVGHNPASQELVLDLTGLGDLAFPTSALAVVRLPGSWADTGPGGGELARIWTPRTQ